MNPNISKHYTQNCLAKWGAILEHEDLPKIQDSYRKQVTSVLLENQEKDIRGNLHEAAPTNSMGASSSTPGDGAIDTYDPVLISLVRRSAPQLIAFDIVGVQPMTMPTGLIFALRSRYDSQTGVEALFDEANTGFSADNATNSYNSFSQTGTTPDEEQMLYGSNAAAYTVQGGMTTAQAEKLGTATATEFNEMAFSIEQISVTAKSRALKAVYSQELQQDLKAVHGLDAESELANILSTEIIAEQNREIVRTIYRTAKIGAQQNTSTAGIFDLDVDADGRWSVEKYKGLYFQIEREANQIAFDLRRGKGNFIIASADLASALSMTGALDVGQALQGRDLNVDPATTTFAGTLTNGMKVYVDPYIANSGDKQVFTVGYKGNSPFDAGLFYAPYVPLQMVRAIGEDSFQPRIGFKTRYGFVAHPFATDAGDGAIDVTKKNKYYRRTVVTNLM